MTMPSWWPAYRRAGRLRRYRLSLERAGQDPVVHEVSDPHSPRAWLDELAQQLLTADAQPGDALHVVLLSEEERAPSGTHGQSHVGLWKGSKAMVSQQGQVLTSLSLPGDAGRLAERPGRGSPEHIAGVTLACFPCGRQCGEGWNTPLGATPGWPYRHRGTDHRTSVLPFF